MGVLCVFMRRCKHKLRELTFLSPVLGLEFVKNFKDFRCYVTTEGVHIAVLQWDALYSVLLNKALFIQQNGQCFSTNVKPEKLQLDKMYRLYELIS